MRKNGRSGLSVRVCSLQGVRLRRSREGHPEGWTASASLRNRYEASERVPGDTSPTDPAQAFHIIGLALCDLPEALALRRRVATIWIFLHAPTPPMQALAAWLDQFKERVDGELPVVDRLNAEHTVARW